MNVYNNVMGAPDPEPHTGRGLISRQYVIRRRLLYDALKQGGLERQADGAPTYRVLQDSSNDWEAHGRLRSVVQTSLGCHMTEKEGFGPYFGIFSLNSIFCFDPEGGMVRIVISMGAGQLKAYSRAEGTVRWKLSQDDYLRPVEYARGQAGSE
ncbi:MAG: hypothetical protein ACXW3Z_13995 [Limisphaerales bacterium]